MNDPERETNSTGGVQEPGATPPTPPTRVPLGTIVIGALFIAGGVLLGLGQMGWLSIDSVGDLWPLALIGIGAAKLWETRGTPNAGSGAWLVLAGFWFLAVRLHILGLTYRNSWPLLLIFIGIVMVFRSFAPAAPGPGKQEAHNGR